MANVKHLNYFGNMITNNAICTCGIISRNAMAKAASNSKKNLYTSKLARKKK
jgi:hypothetical protein